ncbi:MAG: energy transducer TonB [Burkholderiales bacterium]|nr:energy transducer TonB [Burkholderiales bacterium]
MKRLALFSGMALLWVSIAMATSSGDTLQSNDVNATRRYTRAVLERIVADQAYPREALDRGIQGQVLITARIGVDGQIKTAQLRESSGSEVLDQAAVRTVLAVRNLPSPPFMLRGREFTLGVPIIFRIE